MFFSIVHQLVKIMDLLHQINNVMFQALGLKGSRYKWRGVALGLEVEGMHLKWVLGLEGIQVEGRGIGTGGRGGRGIGIGGETYVSLVKCTRFNTCSVRPECIKSTYRNMQLATGN